MLNVGNFRIKKQALNANKMNFTLAGADTCQDDKFCSEHLPETKSSSEIVLIRLSPFQASSPLW